MKTANIPMSERVQFGPRSLRASENVVSKVGTLLSTNTVSAFKIIAPLCDHSHLDGSLKGGTGEKIITATKKKETN